MRSTRRWAPLALVLAAACARTRSAPAPDAAARETASASDWLGTIAAYPNARALCDEHVMAAPGAPPAGDSDPIREIHWVSFATSASLEELAKFYAARGTPLDTERTYHVRRVVLSVHPGDDTLHPRCGEHLDPSERSVIVVSRALP